MVVPPPPSSSPAGDVVEGVDELVVEGNDEVDDVDVALANMVLVPATDVVVAGVGGGPVVGALVAVGATTVVVVGGASGLVVDGVDCGAAPPGNVANIGAGLLAPAAPIQRTISPVL